MYAGRFPMNWSLVIVVGAVDRVENAHRGTSVCMNGVWNSCGRPHGSGVAAVDDRFTVHRLVTVTPVVFRNKHHFVHRYPQAPVDRLWRPGRFERLSTGQPVGDVDITGCWSVHSLWTLTPRTRRPSGHGVVSLCTQLWTALWKVTTTLSTA